jgi:hypothetical protein
MQKAVGSVQVYDRISIIGIDCYCPTVDDSICILRWTGKRLSWQEQQKPNRNELNNT